jgi:Sporulation and spore germination
MQKRIVRSAGYLLVAWLMISLSGCNFPGQALPTPTAAPTNIPLPSQTPQPTDTPSPSPTFTLAPTTTPPPPAAPTSPPKPPTAEATLTTEQAILVYYINKDENGPFGCGEALWYIKTKQPKTSLPANDIRYALTTILSYHSETIGTLYNPGYASNLAVNNVEMKENGVVVSLTGTYNRTKDPCDGRRLIDQLRQTIKQFEGISTIQITINGTPIADAVSRK